MRHSISKRNAGTDNFMGERNERSDDIGNGNRYGGALGCFIYCECSIPADNRQEDQEGIVRGL